MKSIPSRKLDKKVPPIDYFPAPCRSGCSIEQDIPAYPMRVGKSKYEGALCIIIQRNALSFVTGATCPHRYRDKRTRNAYDGSVYIHAQELKAAEGGFEALPPKLYPAVPAVGRRVAVAGGGPGSIPAAYFLGRFSMDVTVFEYRDALDSIVRYVIPAFRIHDEVIDDDMCPMEAAGVKVELNIEVKNIQELFVQSFTHAILTIGVWQKGSVELEYGEEHNIIEFLEATKKILDTLNLSQHVVVIDDGGTIMDTARTAKRLPGVKIASLVYRGTRRYTPADREELKLALVDGVEFRELSAPVGVRDDVLTYRMTGPGAPDTISRRSPVDTGWTVEMSVDTVIIAVGEKVDTEFYTANGLPMDQRGRAVVNPDTLEPSAKYVFVVDDGQKGLGAVVEAIVGAARAVRVVHPFDADAWME